MNKIRQNAFEDELRKIAVEVYDPKIGPPAKKPVHEDVDLPIVKLRDDAGEQGGSVLSE